MSTQDSRAKGRARDLSLHAGGAGPLHPLAGCQTLELASSCLPTPLVSKECGFLFGGTSSDWSPRPTHIREGRHQGLRVESWTQGGRYGKGREPKDALAAARWGWCCKGEQRSISAPKDHLVLCHEQPKAPPERQQHHSHLCGPEHFTALVSQVETENNGVWLWRLNAGTQHTSLWLKSWPRSHWTGSYLPGKGRCGGHCNARPGSRFPEQPWPSCWGRSRGVLTFSPFGHCPNYTQSPRRLTPSLRQPTAECEARLSHPNSGQVWRAFPASELPRGWPRLVRPALPLGLLLCPLLLPPSPSAGSAPTASPNKSSAH